LPQSSPPEELDFGPCLEAAYRYLSLRPRSEFEVRTRLKKKGFPVQSINRTLAELRRQGYLDDASFARFWTENRESFSPRGRSLLRLELHQKGVEPEVIRQATQDLDDEENAYKAAQKKLKKPVNSDYDTFRRSVGGFLRRRGFSYGVCQRALSRIWREEIGDS
jgi:regulatory protein